MARRGESDMRVLFGLILGIALTIGGAYVLDARSPSAGTGLERPMVNWDVVSQNWDRLSGRVRQEWHRLAAG
jgi:hypothetical protein